MALSIWKDKEQNREDTVNKILRYRNEINSNTIALSFSDFISEKMIEKEMTREKLAIALGYKEGEEAEKKADILKHTIGKVGYTTNRDRIIAICLALKMSHPDTDKALFLYGMLPLDEYNTREKLLIQALTDNIGFLETNRLLAETKMRLLEIEKTKKQPGPHIIREPKEEFIHISDPIYSFGDFVGDKSLSGMYNPNSYTFDGEMILQDDSGIRYTIKASDGGLYVVERENKDGLYIGTDKYKSLSECMKSSFSKYFLELEDGIRQKVRHVLSTMDDTRNYKMRFDAEVNNSQLDLFVEVFNYDCPEYSEYYQMERSNGKYRMTVTHESIYMRHHMGKYYSQYYNRSHKVEIIAEYTSIEDIQNSKETNRSGMYWKKERIIHFKKLQDKLNQLIKDLKEKTIMINDPFSCFDDIYYDLASFYKIQDLFIWEQCKDSLHMFSTEDSCPVPTKDGFKVPITLDEIKRAFELGIYSVDDICLVKSKYGEIDGILI